MLIDYIPVIVVFIVAAGFVSVSMLLTHLLGPKIKNSIKLSPYESGVDPVGKTRVRMSIKYFLVALIFIIFDIEVVFLFPWAVVFKDFLNSGWTIFIEMAVFLFILGFGFLFIWKKGALDWE